MSQRLLTALSNGAIDWPEGGRVALYRPGEPFDLPGPALVVTGDKRAAEAWSRHGAEVVRGAPETDLAIVTLGRSKSLNRDMIARAAASADRVVIDGAKTDGVDAIFKEMRKTGLAGESVTKAHGRVFWFDRTDTLAHWRDPGPVLGDDGFWRQAGVFSEAGVDRGSQVLAGLLPELKGRWADLGGGWGFLTRVALEKGANHVDLVEVEARALDCAERTLEGDPVTFHWADATLWTPAERIDGVLMNPPFHQGRTADARLGQAFIGQARVFDREVLS